MKAILKRCINQNYIQYNNEIYQQKEGLPMGSPISPLLAEIFMSHFKSNLLETINSLIKNTIFWAEEQKSELFSEFYQLIKE